MIEVRRVYIAAKLKKGRKKGTKRTTFTAAQNWESEGCRFGTV